MKRSATVVSTLLLLVLVIIGVATFFSLMENPESTPVHPSLARIVEGGGSGGSTGVSCPSGSTISWGPISLNCFQSLDLAEIGAILIGVGIAVYIYWDSDEAELPGDSAEVPVTSEEEVAMARRRKEEVNP